MDSPHSGDQWQRRFILGALSIGVAVFGVTLLYSESFARGLLDSSAMGIGFGTIAGVFSAWGKRLYSFVRALALEILLNP